MILMRIRRFKVRKPTQLKLSHFILFVLVMVVYLLVLYNVSEWSLKTDVELEGWKVSTSRNVLDYIDPVRDTARIKPKEFWDCERVPRGLAWFFVFSAPENFRRR